MPRAQTRAATRPSVFAPLPLWLTTMTLSVLVLLAGAATAQEQKIIKSHGYSFYGDLNYPADFKHFDYVNPDAPKGGEISLPFVGTFDSMNPYSRKGRAASVLDDVSKACWVKARSGERLPADVYGESYGLLAKALEYPEAKSG